MVKVSVIIPFKKARRFYIDAIDSVNKQKGVAVEILTGGGGSLGHNVNKLVKKASGEFIKILADDDVLWDVNSLSHLVECMERDSLDWVRGGAVNFHGDRFEVGRHKPAKTITLATMLERNQIHGGGTMYRRDLWRRFGGWDEWLPYSEEYDWHLNLLNYNAKHGRTEALVYGYRIWGENKSRANLSYMVENGGMTLKKSREAWRKFKKEREPVIDKIKKKYV